MPYSATQKTALGFGLAFAISVGVGAMAYWNIGRMAEDNRLVAHTHQVLTELESTHAALLAAETSQRGYVITGVKEDLELYHASIHDLDQRIEAIRAMTRDNPTQQESLAAVERKARARLSQLVHTLDLQARYGPEAARQYIASGIGNVTMAEVRAQITRMQDEEYRLLQLRNRETVGSTRRTSYTVAAGTLISFSILVIVLYQLAKEVKERKQAEEALRASEEQLQAILDNATALVYLKDLDGRFTFVNHALEVAHQKTRDQLLGCTNYDLFPRAMADVYLAGDRLALESPSPVETELEAPLADGPRTFLSTRFPLRDRTGEPYAICGFAVDITERKRMESEVQELNEKLQRHAAQLEATNKELEAFSYSVSHDLRAPLRSIDGFSQALLEDYADKLDDPGRGYLQRVRGATQRMGQLIDDMLNLSRISRSEMNREIVNLSALARSIVAELKLSDTARDVEFAIEEGVEACGDARLLKVVLENLLGNAWKFSTKHERACIEFGQRNEQGETVYYVRDDGAGFDEKYADKLFGAFQRLHGMEEFAGTGVGLATVARIVHRHNGRIWAEGAVEAGATFNFTL